MTEPIDGSERESGQPRPEPTAEPAPEPSEPAAPTGADPQGGWVKPTSDSSRGSLRRGCVIALLVVAVGVLALLVGLAFLGSQLASSLGGTIEFGTGGTGCSITGSATTFPASSPFRAVAYLERDTRAGETVTAIVTFSNGRSESNDQTFDGPAKCITEDVPPGLEPGHYVLEYRSGAEVLATGAFDITP